MYRLSTPLLVPLVALVVGFFFIPAAGSAAPSTPRLRGAVAADHALLTAMHLRDRGRLDDTLGVLRELLTEHPLHFSAHRLYMEIASVSRRNGGLIEAEYRHYLAQDPGDGKRIALHAAALMTQEMTSPGPVKRARLRELERELAAAEADPKAEPWARFVAYELDRLRRQPGSALEHLERALELKPGQPDFQSEMVPLLVRDGEFAAAASLCRKLLKKYPWRAWACASVFPRRAGDPSASEEARDAIIEDLDRIEQRWTNDATTLQGLEALYADLGDRKGVKRLRARLTALEDGWQPPLSRNPYLSPPIGGELEPAEAALFERIAETVEANEDEPWLLVEALNAMKADLPDAGRARSVYFRQLAYALRDQAVLDRDGSRAAAMQAMQALPDEPHAMNEWAYMSALDKVDLVEALATVERALELLLGEPFDLINLDPGEGFGQWEIGRAESVGAFVDTRGWVLYQLGRHQEAERDLELASLLTGDGTVQGHLGRARYASGNDGAAFHNLLRALALGTEEEGEVRNLARYLYDKQHVIPGGLQALVDETRRQIGQDFADAAEDLFLDLSPEGSSPRGPTPEGRYQPQGPGDQGRSLGPDSAGGERDSESKASGRLPGNPDPTRQHSLLGEAAPEFSLQTVSGDPVELSALRGQVVVLDFWATWCGPCVDSLPALTALHGSLAGEAVRMLLVSLDDSEADVEAFLADRGLDLEVVMGSSELTEAYGVSGIPATFVIDGQGIVRSYQAGYADDLIRRLQRQVLELLDEDAS